MKRIGITGGIGSGKTTVGTSLSKTFSIPFYDALYIHQNKSFPLL